MLWRSGIGLDLERCRLELVCAWACLFALGEGAAFWFRFSSWWFKVDAQTLGSMYPNTIYFGPNVLFNGVR